MVKWPNIQKLRFSLYTLQMLVDMTKTWVFLPAYEKLFKVIQNPFQGQVQGYTNLKWKAVMYYLFLDKQLPTIAFSIQPRLI